MGTRSGERRRIVAFIPYDDIDPNCLNGAILFDGSRMDMVWDRCREAGLSVVADVHVHPGHYGQSDIDRANPMLPERGHLALIVPHYAARAFHPGQIGIYEFCGGRTWLDHSRRGSRFFRLEPFR